MKCSPKILACKPISRTSVKQKLWVGFHDNPVLLHSHTDWGNTCILINCHLTISYNIVCILELPSVNSLFFGASSNCLYNTLYLYPVKCLTDFCILCWYSFPTSKLLFRLYTPLLMSSIPKLLYHPAITQPSNQTPSSQPEIKLLLFTGTSSSAVGTISSNPVRGFPLELLSLSPSNPTHWCCVR